MKYTYAYKTSDGVRHEDSTNASSREEVFETLRAQGIKAIKVVAADGSKANGEIRGVRKRVVVTSIVVAALTAGLIAFLVGRRVPTPPELPPTSATETPPPAEQHVATALPRQEIQGDRKRIGKADEVFDNKADAFFARFAEPGRIFFAPESDWPSAEEMESALKEQLKVSDDELTEIIDLKRIVTGIRRELRLYIQGGGTSEGFIRELVKRQEYEIATRKRAVDRLSELLNNKASKGKLKEAYTFWLTSNAQLASMGIFPIPIPEILRDYQQTLNLGDQL